ILRRVHHESLAQSAPVGIGAGPSSRTAQGSPKGAPGTNGREVAAKLVALTSPPATISRSYAQSERSPGTRLVRMSGSQLNRQHLKNYSEKRRPPVNDDSGLRGLYAPDAPTNLKSHCRGRVCSRRGSPPAGRDAWPRRS